MSGTDREAFTTLLNDRKCPICNKDITEKVYIWQGICDECLYNNKE